DKLDKLSEEELKKWQVKKGEVVLSPATDVKAEAKRKPNDPSVNTDEWGEKGKGGEEPAAKKKKKEEDPDDNPSAFKTPPPVVQLPPPQQIDAKTVKFKVGNYPGRVAFSIRKPGEKLPPFPKPGKPAEPAAVGKRDDYIRAAMNLTGVPFQAG